MRTIETFFRSREIRRERSQLAATCYNRARLLQRRVDPEPLFIPIRSMLFLAVIDAQEIIFVDGAVSRTRIEIAWQHFRPQRRASLDAPIPYEVVFYTQPSLTIMSRLHSEFRRALQQVYERSHDGTPGSVVYFRGAARG